MNWTTGGSNLDKDKLYSKEHYDELVNIIRLLKEGLEEIATDNWENEERSVEILQSMEDTCKQSKLTDIQNLPKLLNT